MRLALTCSALIRASSGFVNEAAQNLLGQSC
jgi:hypothetical protein